MTTVPQQALFLMNSPFVIEQAKHLAGSLEASSDDPEARVRLLYQRVFGRSPEPREVALGVAFVARQSAAGTNPPPKGLAPWEEYAQVLLLTNEFMFVD